MLLWQWWWDHVTQRSRPNYQKITKSLRASQESNLGLDPSLRSFNPTDHVVSTRPPAPYIKCWSCVLFMPKILNFQFGHDWPINIVFDYSTMSYFFKTHHEAQHHCTTFATTNTAHRTARKNDDHARISIPRTWKIGQKFKFLTLGDDKSDTHPENTKCSSDHDGRVTKWALGPTWSHVWRQWFSIWVWRLK